MLMIHITFCKPWGAQNTPPSISNDNSDGSDSDNKVSKDGSNINSVVTIFNLCITCCIFMNSSMYGTYRIRDTKGLLFDNNN